MAVGDTYYYSSGRPYVQTEGGPCFTWECSDCGGPAIAAFEYTGTVRCGACWVKYHGLGPQRTTNANKDLVSDGC